MRTKMFAVFDTKTQSYGVPFFQLTIGAAVRSFSDVANDERSMIAKHGSDYILFQVGEFDDSTGMSYPCDVPINLGNASSFIEKVAAVPAVVDAVGRDLGIVVNGKGDK